jgi:hypothetical protein
MCTAVPVFGRAAVRPYLGTSDTEVKDLALLLNSIPPLYFSDLLVLVCTY